MQFYQSYLIQQQKQTDNQQSSQLKSTNQINGRFQILSDNLSDNFLNSFSTSLNGKYEKKAIKQEQILKESSKSISNSDNILHEEIKLFNKVKNLGVNCQEISNSFISIDSSVNLNNNKQIIK